MPPATQRAADPSVVIPAAIRAAGAHADEIMKQMLQPQADPAAPPVDPNTPAEPPATPPEAAAPAQPPAPPPAPPSDPEETWEKRYKALKGRHDRFVEQHRDVTARVQQLEATLASLQNNPPAAPIASDEPLVSQKEIEDYGPDLLEVVGKKAMETIRPLLRERDNYIKQLEARLGGDARQQLIKNMNDALPDWTNINHRPEFLEWLALPDPYTGDIRLDQLKAAFEQNKFPQVLAFFKGFLAEEAALDPAAMPRDPVAPAAPGAQPADKVPLASLAAPGRAKSAASNAPAEKPVIKTSDITAFYADAARGKYRGKEEAYHQYEAELMLAQREGRVIPG